MEKNNKFDMRIQKGVSVYHKKKKISLPVLNICKGAPFCVRMEASYMAEFSIALPFFTGFIAALLFFFQILTAQQEIGNALLATGRELSVIDCHAEMAGQMDLLAAKALMIKNLKKDGAAENFVRGGRIGISMIRSDFSSNYITLQADYQIRFPFGLFGKKGISGTQIVKLRKWTGKSKDDLQEEIVYITKNGSVFHRQKDCSYIKRSVKKIEGSIIDTLRNVGGGKYYPCIMCMKKKNPNTMEVYVTAYGNRYHSKKNCSEIKRNAFAVRLSSVKDRAACSKCGKGK